MRRSARGIGSTAIPGFADDLFCAYHRPLKLRTDGGYARVRELGSIDLFVVTSVKMNELSPNFEHKLLIMCGMLAANFIAI